MYLKSLELQGFKSFPDKTLIRFGDDITAIVGPNGSGKSNISDAILWVMGEQSTKTLRGAKMEDVIFGGTQKRSAVGFAEATLTLDNTDRALAYDADEVMVTRRFYRSGDSEYYINKQSSRLRDIHEMFMDTGLGREGYSNIGQGRIDEILSLKSGDRREIFEEAAGISKYRHRKEETERKLLHTEDNLLRIGDKVSELELQLEPLKVQSEKAKKYLELKEELRGVEVAVWMETLEKLSAAAKKAEEDYASASFVLQQAHDDLDSLYRQAEQLGETLRRRDGELDTLRLKSNMLSSTHQQFEGQMAVLQGNLQNNTANIARIEEELQGQDDRSGGVTAQIRQTECRIAEIEAALGEKHRMLEELKQQLAAMTANAQGLTKQYLELRGKESSLAADIAGRQADVRGLEDSMLQTRERLEQLNSDLSAGTARRHEAEMNLEDSRKELRRARENVTAANNTIAGYALRQSNRLKRRDELSGELHQLTAQLESISAKARVFRAMERDFESYQKSVKLVMQEAQRGSLRNVHGPVSRLVRTEDAYTVAIEIALGAAMQQIVVGAEADGKAAISYLKRTGGGRATFLPMNTIQGRYLQESGLENCRGYVGIASGLVDCEHQYRGIVDNLLGRTVIVSDMDAAIHMSQKYKNRFKIVTLDGQVMNPGGSMTGGSTNREAGILSRANELSRLTAQEKKLQQDRSICEADLQEAQRLYDQVEFQMGAARDQLREAEDQVLRLQGQEKQYEILVQAIAEAEQSARREKETLDARDRSDRERYAAQQAKIQVYAQQLAEIRDQLAALEGSQTEASERTANMTEQMTALKTEEAALDAEAVTARTHIADLQNLRSSMEGDREKKLMLMDSIRQDSLRLEQELAVLRRKQQENDAEASQMNSQLQKMLTVRAETEANKTRAEREAQEKSKDILNMERACALLSSKKETTAIEERTIIDKLWESYGLTPGTAADHAAEIENAASGNRRIGELKRKIGALGTPNLGAIEEYARVNERYSYLASQRDDVLNSKRELESIIRDITKEMTTIFVSEFQKINHYFGEVFEEMFGGGKGQLILEDPENPLSCGIEIRVQPPGKQVKTITLLSGGEKAFVATALYFAILKVRPTPFCLLDEIDAALDDRNVERFAKYLHNLSRNTQFIVITHRRGTMEASDVLYGVTMQEQGVSKLLRLDLNQMEQYLGIVE
ncbi:MAG: chromosome segregation protein SMC [Oscillospiraceae bacterium]|nr:chromosome segregation protein SMC [Oscillospiraceae bacterium]MBQ7130149.1 chromosome segregation protein SMC [Oscillospiraceae bacterium]